ncbi:MAG TPA: DNA-processing protein DprA [Candidatus Cloacimonadota bacterium]|jgi:predicted Rossmann fold nucleotide-binding protein DprA/Smf involved in DNA uptake|nr:DNA-processing protein DprA [Candidatus Cloacimonadales bacterium]HPY97303.1 DNA-processing protein DprA [Candidatus Cloacimonadota bacterium]HQB40968.1 DNA-processing protein DprA [Candidatus Cloacimonadota bacterium]
MIAALNQDSLVTLLLCSNLHTKALEEEDYKPFTLSQWNNLAVKIANSALKKPASLLNAGKDYLQKELELNEEEGLRLDFLLKQGANLAFELEKLTRLGIKVTTRSEENYPKRLRALLKAYSPTILYYSGDIELANRDYVAIVGSRDIDDQGLNFAKELTKSTIKEGLGVVSGGAKGVDSIAESSCLDHGGLVISFVSDSLSNKIKNQSIRNAIMEGRLLIMSAVSPYERFFAYNAMDRNKYVYALSQLAVVVASGADKGGTWSGAVENLKKKWVPLYVRDEIGVPEGNEKLLQQGGKGLSNKDLQRESFSFKKLIESYEQDKPKEYVQMDLFSLE